MCVCLCSYPFSTFSIVAALLRQCTGAYLQRVLAKFTENEHEKVDRLVELHFQYHERVTKANAKIETFREVSTLRPSLFPSSLFFSALSHPNRLPPFSVCPSARTSARRRWMKWSP